MGGAQRRCGRRRKRGGARVNYPSYRRARGRSEKHGRAPPQYLAETPAGGGETGGDRQRRPAEGEGPRGGDRPTRGCGATGQERGRGERERETTRACSAQARAQSAPTPHRALQAHASLALGGLSPPWAPAAPKGRQAQAPRGRRGQATSQRVAGTHRPPHGGTHTHTHTHTYTQGFARMHSKSLDKLLKTTTKQFNINAFRVEATEIIVKIIGEQ